MAEENKPKTLEEKIKTATKGPLKDLRDQRELLKKVNYDVEGEYLNNLPILEHQDRMKYKKYFLTAA